MGGVEPALFGGTPPLPLYRRPYASPLGDDYGLLGADSRPAGETGGEKAGLFPAGGLACPPEGGGLAIGLAALCILLNALDWGTLKVIGEFQKKGPLLFAGQYLYYAFEVVLVLLIAAFGQQFWEALRKGRSQFPFGGVVLCCTWGAIHTLSRGSLSTGLGVMAFGLMYGAIYVLLGRDARTPYLAMLAAFVI